MYVLYISMSFTVPLSLARLSGIRHTVQIQGSKVTFETIIFSRVDARCSFACVHNDGFFTVVLQYSNVTSASSALWRV